MSRQEVGLLSAQPTTVHLVLAPRLEVPSHRLGSAERPYLFSCDASLVRFDPESPQTGPKNHAHSRKYSQRGNCAGSLIFPGIQNTDGNSDRGNSVRGRI